ncbi:Protein aurora borealis [Eumeta japonica]|uniref:Protein aurora borealis n=1 Tax=Eumeta variegata TaxID=151549 RepID=A0A4C1T6T7_EUMVA|nr:Protein aurora borealis [Eumeta japonica]
MVRTPPAKRFHRVKNPFEAALAEKLHLPLIASEADVELLSPIHPLSTRKRSSESNRSQYRNHENDLSKTDSTENITNETGENESFTPERSSSPLNLMLKNNIAEFSTDSFNVKVSRLKVNSSKIHSNGKETNNNTENRNLMEIDIFQHDDTEDMLESTVDMDEMHVSQLSAHSSNGSSSQSDTPRSKRRSASRKTYHNLFQLIGLRTKMSKFLKTRNQ